MTLLGYLFGAPALTAKRARPPRVAFDKAAPPGAFAARAFDAEKREIGIVSGVIQHNAMVTTFMSTRYTKDAARRPVLLLDPAEREAVPHEDFTGQGVGRALLNALVKEACKRGLVVASGTDRSAMMERFWAKQMTSGRAMTRPAKPAFVGDQDYEYIVTNTCKHPGFQGLRARKLR